VTVQAAPPSVDPRAWTAATIDDSSNWYFRLPAPALAILDRVLRDLGPDPRDLARIRLSDTDRVALREQIQPALNALEAGRGFVVIDGADPARYGDEGLTTIYWLVGQPLGEPFEQNVQGTILYDVKDTGQSVEYGARFSVTNADSSFHTDNSFGDTTLDYVGLLCLRTARSGGINQMVSGYTVVDELRRRHPEALEVLSQPFHVDRRGGVKPGQEPTARIPVVQWHGDELELRYLRYWIEVGHEKAGQPLTENQVRALDLLDETAARPDLRAEFSLKPGDMFFCNNRWTLHNRTAFDDHPEPEKRRHLVRLWLRR
jgi:alpha-ketoglutarate-dependent taurine dioxygenase